VSRLAVQAVPDLTTEFRYLGIVAVFFATAVMAFVASLLPIRRINSIRLTKLAQFLRESTHHYMVTLLQQT
jgi:hypothetical protein